VIIDENPDSVNDAAFAVRMEPQWPATLWQDGPANYHGGGCASPLPTAIPKSRNGGMAALSPSKLLLLILHVFRRSGKNPDIRWVQERTTARHS